MAQSRDESIELMAGKHQYSLKSSSLTFVLTLLVIAQGWYLVHLHLKPLDAAHAKLAQVMETHDQHFERLAEAIDLLAKALMNR